MPRNLFVRHCYNEPKEPRFLNHPEHLEYMSAAIQSAGVKPELEVFDTGHILNAIKLIKNGLIQSPPFSVCRGLIMVPATVDSIIIMKNMLPRNAVWSAFGISSSNFQWLPRRFYLEVM